MEVRVDVAWVADSDYHVFLQPLPILSFIRKGHHGIVDISYAGISHDHFELMNPIISHCIADHAGLQTPTSRQHPAQYPSITDILHLYDSH